MTQRPPRKPCLLNFWPPPNTTKLETKPLLHAPSDTLRISLVRQAHNPSYSGGWGSKITSSRPAWTTAWVKVSLGLKTKGERGLGIRLSGSRLACMCEAHGKNQIMIMAGSLLYIVILQQLHKVTVEIHPSQETLIKNMFSFFQKTETLWRTGCLFMCARSNHSMLVVHKYK